MKQERVQTLRTEHLLCLQSNLNKYLAAAEDPLVIFLAACPETDLATIMAGSSKNMAVADVEIAGDSPEKPAEVIVFSREQLNCLAKLDVELDRPVVQIPRQPCQ